jgi:arylsulfatase A-like enzyme
MSDDMGWADLGSYGSLDIHTPNIDTLARDGIRLTDFYANGVFCSPTRAGLISGRYQQRYGVETPLPGAAAARDLGLTASGTSLPQLLKNTGYSTALVGKWHLGYQPNQIPNAHGFDYFFGLLSGYHDYYTHNAGDGKPDLYENNKPITETGYMTDLITTHAKTWIKDHAKGPFFIDVAFNAPHWPYQAPDHPTEAANNARHVMPSDDFSSRADYMAMVERMDRGVGEILALLKELKLDDNTIVVFTNDNGGEWLANNQPLFNRKYTTWEGGIRVPALIRWPGHIPAGKVSDQVGITMDLTASFLAAAGAKVPANAKQEGMNLLPIFEGKAPEVERTLYWRVNNGGHQMKAVRQGDWKLVMDGAHQFIYNIRIDVSERNDLAKYQQARAHTLRQLLADWEKDIDAEAPKRAERAVPANQRPAD